MNLKAVAKIELELTKWIDDFFTNFMNDPELMESTTKSMLEKTMIEPSLDTTLSLIMGLCMGSVNMLAETIEPNVSTKLEVMDKMDKIIQVNMIQLREGYARAANFQ